MTERPSLPGGWLPPSAEPLPRFDAPPEPAAASGWQPPVAPAPRRAAVEQGPLGRAAPSAGTTGSGAAASTGAPGSTAAPAGAPQSGAAPRGRVAGAGNPHAVWALVLGVLGLVVLALTLGWGFFLALPCSVAAWVLAESARGRVARGATSEGAGLALAALWVARIGVLVGVVALIVIVVLVATGFDVEGFRDELERELERRRDRS